jgi:hypothetical protein
LLYFPGLRSLQALKADERGSGQESRFVRRGTLIALLLFSMLPRLSVASEVERGLAIVDPLALRELDLRNHRTEAATHPGFSLGRMLDPAGPSSPLRNDTLFALPSMATVRAAIDAEFERYIARHRAATQQSIGVGPGHDVQLFDRDRLWSGAARFVLTGIVNRIDRGFVDPESCGEIRLIYRLTDQAAGNATPQRLPMTLNLVLKGRGDDSITCAEIARRWLEAGASQLTGAELALSLMAPGGPLALITPEQIDRIETNLQIAHVPKSAVAEFRTDYLLKVFRRDRQAQLFVEAPLENQIDRDRLIADPDLASGFKRWLLEPSHLVDFDRGIVLFPEKFLARGAIAPTPAGLAPSAAQPAFGLVGGDDSAVFSDGDIVAALQRAADSGIALKNIRSPAGFERRLNDITCSGCHQTRGIGGFHFPGTDWTTPASSAVPGSPHFVGDQIRRRDILAALRDGNAPDYSRGFSARPQLRGSATLHGTEYDDGWGATCYRADPNGANNDPSFQSWTCAEGLSCQRVGSAASRIGMCFVADR